MLEVRELTVQYPHTDAPVLDAVSLVAPPGVTAVVGPSGSGKTTLFRAIAGEIPIGGGQILLNGVPLTERHVTIGVVHQDYRLIDFLTVGENLELARELAGLSETAGLVDELLDQVGLPDYSRRMVTTLSGGQQQRVAIARALAIEPGLVLADEPTGSLDRRNTDAVAALLHELGERAGIPILLATHDPRIAAIAARVLELTGDGRIMPRTGVPA